MKLIILSGRSGAGKTVVLNTLEDHGFYCIDNLPLSVLPLLIQKVPKMYTEIAVSIDTRTFSDELEQFDAALSMIDMPDVERQIVYIDSQDSVLLRRYSETRRRHPLTNTGLSLSEAIASERTILEPIVRRADLKIDTSDLIKDELYQLIRKRVIQKDAGRLDLLFQSFGFKHGVPRDVDFVFDARCLPNPYWDVSLRPMTGSDQPVIDYLEQHEMTGLFVEQIAGFITEWLPRFESQSRNYLTVAIGCTGGQHRSVYVAEQLALRFSKSRDHVKVRHREQGDVYKDNS